jgi:hypothetical protein
MHISVSEKKIQKEHKQYHSVRISTESADMIMNPFKCLSLYQYVVSTFRTTQRARQKHTIAQAQVSNAGRFYLISSQESIGLGYKVEVSWITGYSAKIIVHLKV